MNPFSATIPRFLKRAAILIVSILSLGIAQTGWGQTTIGIHDFEVTNGSPAMTRSTATTSGSPSFSDVVSGNSPSSSASPTNSPYFTSADRGYRHAGPSSGSTVTIVTHTFGAVDTRNYADIAVSIRVASMSIGTTGNGIESDDYCEIAVSPDNGITWYQQSRLIGNASTSNKRWALNGTGSVSRGYLANNTLTNHSVGGGSTEFVTGANAITTMTVTGLPAVENLRIRVQTRNNSAAESWIIDDVRVSGTVVTIAPTVATASPATSITVSGATAGGSINATGGANATVRGIEYSTTDGFVNGTGTQVTESGDFSTGAFTRNLTGLSAGTTYYYKAFATNSGGTGYGAQESFLTLPAAPAAPTASAVSSTGFTVNWSPVVSASSYRLDVSLTEDFSSFVSGFEDISVVGTSQLLTGLSSETTYYARVRAVNATGIGANSGVLSQETDSATSPAINRTPGSLAGFTYAFNAGPSASQSFTVSAVNLSPADGNLVVSAAGTDYEVSTDDSSFGTSVNLGYTGGTLADTTVHVRMKAGLVVASYGAQELEISGGGASAQTVALSGSVTAGMPPVLTAAPAANVDAAFDITFPDNTTWRGGITGITVDGIPLTSGFAFTAGTLTLNPSASVPAALLQSIGTKEIVVSSANYGSSSISQVIAAGAAAQLAVVTQPTAPASNGASLVTQPTIAIRDQYGNPTTSGASVTAAVGAGTWVLGGTAVVDAVSGIATFSGLSATAAAAVTGATIEFSSPGLTAVTSSNFSIPAPDFIQLIAAPVTENFDSMAATTTLPLGWKMAASTASPTWSAAGTTVTQQASSGSPATGGTYNWGTSSSERAVGAMTSGGFASPNNLIVKVRNSTGSTVDALEIAYKAERYRVNSAAASVQLFYSLDGTAWTSISAGDIASSEFPTGSSSYTFATPLTITRSGVEPTGLGLANGAFIYFRWNINTTGSSSQGIGIDDISIGIASPPTAPIVATGTAGGITRSTAEITASNVSSDGKSAVTERGVVFSTSADPTTADAKVVVSGTTGIFNASLTGLTGGVTYHARAFATNAIGTSYGSDITFTTNSAPTFSGMTVNTSLNSPATILEAKVLARVSDADLDTVSITGVTTPSTQGAAVSRSGGIITYTPASGFNGADTFTVSIDDGFGAVDIAINVNVGSDPLFTSPSNAPRISELPGGAKRIAFNGIPGRTYAIQRSTTMTPGSWTQIAAVTAAPDSSVSFDDPTPPSPSAFYRIAYPAE